MDARHVLDQFREEGCGRLERPQFGVEFVLDLDDPVRVGATRGRLGQRVGQLTPHVLPRCYPPVSAQAVELDRQNLP